MFAHNFKYTLRSLLRMRALIFWSITFPVIMSILFYFAFGMLSSDAGDDPIDIAVVKEDGYEKNMDFIYAFDRMSKGKNNIFDVSELNKDQAVRSLDDNKICAYITIGAEVGVFVKKNGVDQTIIKEAVDQIQEIGKVIGIKYQETGDKARVTKTDISKIAENMLEGEVKIKDATKNNMDVIVIEFYTLIAMTCLYGANIGLSVINGLLANMSYKGKRIGISPASKSKLIFSGVAAGYLVQLLGLGILYTFTSIILNINYGDNFPMLVIASLAGSLAGMCMGVAIAATLKISENAKIGAVISISMACLFFAGMMGVTMKFIVDNNIPLLNKVNPANMITDALYSLYYYGVGNRFYINLISLLIFALIMIAISISSLRRQNYDSI